MPVTPTTGNTRYTHIRDRCIETSLVTDAL
jgi:hypothetical protein